MPPFRYFGNIRGRMGVRFGLSTGAWEGVDYARECSR